MSTTDSFGRMRIAQPTSIYDAQFQYNGQDLFWETALTGGGSSVHLPNESSMLLSCAGAGDRVIRQSKYFRYQPGKTQEITQTFVFGAKEACTKRVGYFDGENGIFISQDANGLALTLRSKSSGAVVDTTVRRDDWNIDRMDGEYSRFNFDETNAQIVGMRLQWLGVGNVRVGFNIDEEQIWVHEFRHSNELDLVYMTTANLPLRYEIESDGGAGSFKQVCSSVVSSGGIQKEGIIHSAANKVGTSVTTPVSVLAIRPKLLFGGITNRIPSSPLTFHIKADVEPIYYQLMYLPQAGGAMVFTDSGANSSVEYSVTAQTMSGGIILDSGFVESGGPGASEKFAATQAFTLDLLSKFSIGLSIDGTGQDLIALVAESLTGPASTVRATLSWREFV